MPWLSNLFKKSPEPRVPAPILLSNTLTGRKEVFIPLRARRALMYSCGPTAYGPAHLGNLRTALLSDTVARTLAAADYEVHRVTNITDFGHLVSDGDEGEDKMTKGLKREGLELTLDNMRTMAERYATLFIDDLAALNVDTSAITFPRASDYIPQQIELIALLEKKGFAYRTKQGVYFDTARFAGYGKLGGLDLAAQQEGTRAKVNREKHNVADFVLWKPDAKLGWESPWGLGFPGWHIECSAMVRSLLGPEIDIHTGGEDLRAIHHNNEIAQSEAASGRAFARYWLHGAFLNAADGTKASKSEGNVFYLSDVVEDSYHPLALRYLFLQGHYRTPLAFSWESLAAASAALERLWRLSREIARESNRRAQTSDATKHFVATMRDDLNTPQAVAALWDALKSDDYTPEEKWGLLEAADAHLGLSLIEPPEHLRPATVVPEDIAGFVAEREKARGEKDFVRADTLRGLIEERGYRVDDGPEGPVVTKQR